MSFILKIKLKDTINKIQREVKIPKNITAKQLAKVLIYSMGWSGEYSYEIFLPKNNMIITNDIISLKAEKNEKDYKIKQTDKIRTIKISGHIEEAVKLNNEPTFIGETDFNLSNLLEKEEKIEFIYDFADRWIHYISVEKNDENIEVPEIISFCGNCPPEDCGGTESYNNFYEFLKLSKKEKEKIDWGYGVYEKDFSQINAINSIMPFFQKVL